MPQQVLLISKACVLETQALMLTYSCRPCHLIKRGRRWPCRAQVRKPQAMRNVPSHLSHPDLQFRNLRTPILKEARPAWHLSSRAGQSAQAQQACSCHTKQ